MPGDDVDARDADVIIHVTRTLLRRILADLEFYRGFVAGCAVIDPRILPLPCGPDDDRSVTERLDNTQELIGALMSVGDITPDEDLDD